MLSNDYIAIYLLGRINMYTYSITKTMAVSCRERNKTSFTHSLKFDSDIFLYLKIYHKYFDMSEFQKYFIIWRISLS